LTAEGVRRVELKDLGVLRIAGPDAVRFLQGQLSNDVSLAAANRSVLAGYHNPQGRVIALLRLVQTEGGDLLAVLPRELVADVAGRLRKYVLRSKVVLKDDSEAWRVQGVTEGSPALPNSIAIGQGRSLVLVPRDAAAIAEDARDGWTALDIAEGVPQVYTATSEAFVAQMVNLDVLDGIAFDKGCYTGQEVIARAHYRGRVKRRMQRFRSLGPAALVRGDSGQLSDGRSFKVVESVQLPDGRCEFLAVAQVAAGASEEADASVSADRGQTIAAEQLPLPYALPA
jgi:tRNA-modifying protein YgfZ